MRAPLLELILGVFVLAVLLTFCSVDSLGAIMEFGGSDYVMTQTNPNALDDAKNWKDNAIFHSPACLGISSFDEIHKDLAAMIQGQQQKIALMLWHAHLKVPDACQGYLVNSASNRSILEVANNVSRIIHEAKRVGFRQIQIRFAPQWINNPKNWTVWNDALYLENAEFIRVVAKRQQDIEGIDIKYDMGSELAGLDNSLVERYVKRLWNAREELDTQDKAYGFSMAYGAGRLVRYARWMKDLGSKPQIISLDIYKSVYDGLLELASEVKRLDLQDVPILIQETFYNDKKTYDQIKSASTIAGLKIYSIMQWPTSRDSGKSITESTTPKYLYKPTK